MHGPTITYPPHDETRILEHSTVWKQGVHVYQCVGGVSEAGDGR